jgi:hypothetical protein
MDGEQSRGQQAATSYCEPHAASSVFDRSMFSLLPGVPMVRRTGAIAVAWGWAQA